MKNFKLMYLFILLLLVSCKKEVFPNKSDIIGAWIEQTNNPFKHKLVFKEETLYFFKSSSTDTLSYWLDEKNEVLSLQLLNSQTDITTKHKISFNKKNKELRIWGLFISAPEESETLFKKD